MSTAKKQEQVKTTVNKTAAPNVIAQEKKKPKKKVVKPASAPTPTCQARVVPFDPEKVYWQIVHVGYDGESVDYLLFDPLSTPDPGRVAQCFVNINSSLDDEHYRPPGDFIALLVDNYTDNQKSREVMAPQLLGEFSAWPEDGRVVKVGRVLTGCDFDW